MRKGANACNNSGTQGGGAKARGNETRRYGAGRGDPGGRRWGHGERTNDCKDSGENGGGTEVSGDEMRMCSKRRGDAGENGPGENAGRAVQVLVGRKSGGDA